MEASPIQVIKILMANGVMASINQTVDFDTAAVVASELGFEPELEQVVEEAAQEEKGEIPLWRRMIADEKEKDLKPRPPVISMLGHVDHGKTSLLDAIRQTNVAGGEEGGITQHIGAYQIDHKGRKITFLDTPGHAAFTSMRARGAQGADIVILVVAADDGVMPQTREAANHALAAKVPIIVALNKMDLPSANAELAKRQLSELGLVPDDWDGDTIVVPVSAKKKDGLDDLMADNNKIEANPNGKVLGTVVEAELDKSRGVMATLLLQNGTIKAGDTILAGESYGRIKAMFDYRGERIKQAGPSTPIMVMGLNDVPAAGDLFRKVKSEKDARAIVAEIEANKQTQVVARKATLEDLYEQLQAGEEQELRLIVKADVQGSLEPIVNSLEEIGDKEPPSISSMRRRAISAKVMSCWRPPPTRLWLALQSIPTTQPSAWPRRKAFPFVCIRSSTGSPKILRRPSRVCWSRNWLKKLWVGPRFWRSSKFPNTAPLPAAG
jgi:translation initiation factor IF-2